MRKKNENSRENNKYICSKCSPGWKGNPQGKGQAYGKRPCGTYTRFK